MPLLKNFSSWFKTITVIPVLFIFTILTTLIIAMRESSLHEPSLPTSISHPEIEYTALTGFFQQDDPATDPTAFDFTQSNFGLITRSYPSDTSLPASPPPTPWSRFTHYVASLNAAARPGERYMVLFLARHGEGWHNVAERHYGTPAWNAEWSRLDGDGSMQWADARLTDTGIGQAGLVNAFWRAAGTEGVRVPRPQSWYTSPLTRCLQTARYSFAELGWGRPVVKEKLREVIGVHTCDRRSSRAYIVENFPEVDVEEGFVEEDELWDPEHRETPEERVYRVKALLDDVVMHDPSTWISFTSHSGAITAMLAVTVHQDFPLRTGAVLPVFLKVDGLPE